MPEKAIAPPCTTKELKNMNLPEKQTPRIQTGNGEITMREQAENASRAIALIIQ